MLRVNAVKELPALSRVGAPDREGSLGDRRVAKGPGSGSSRVVVAVRKVVTTGTQFNQSPGVCLGGSVALVESRRVRERRLRPQAGCLVQPA
jgi:hypothetical protein